MIKKDYILLNDVNFFGKTIKRGSTFKLESNKSDDWYILYENREEILMECPAVRIHYTTIKNNKKYFIEQYGNNSDYDIPLSIDEDFLEQLYWEYDNEINKKNLSERDVFKQCVRRFARREIRKIK